MVRNFFETRACFSYGISERNSNIADIKKDKALIINEFTIPKVSTKIPPNISPNNLEKFLEN